MASDQKGKDFAQKCNGSMSADYGIRAARAVTLLVPSRHRDKMLQRAFDCSLRMAKYLAAGQHWTLDRLSQASAIWGAAFDALLLGDPDDYEISALRARLEDRVDDALVGEAAEVISPPSGAAVRRDSDEVPPAERVSEAAKTGSKTPPQG